MTSEESEEAVVSETTDADHIDVLPDDLQPDLADHEEYLFPNNNRRRIPAVLYLLIGTLLMVSYLIIGDGVFMNRGIFLGGALLVAFGAYSFVSGYNLNVDERDALVASIGQVGFPVGHASAQMGWRGWLSRPTWRILIFSTENPPEKRGLVMVDGVNGEVVETLVEDNTEDWSDYE